MQISCQISRYYYKQQDMNVALNNFTDHFVVNNTVYPKTGNSNDVLSSGNRRKGEKKSKQDGKQFADKSGCNERVE